MSARRLNLISPLIVPISAALLSTVLIGVFISSLQPDVRPFLLIAIALAALFPVVQRVLTGQFDVFEPSLVFTITWLLLFVARPLRMLSEGNFVVETYHVEQGFNAMLVMALFGAIGFSFAYVLPMGAHLGARLPALPKSWHADSVLIYAAVLTGFGYLLFAAYLYDNGGLSTLKNVFVEGRTLTHIEQLQSTSGYFINGAFLAFPAAMLVLASGMKSRYFTLVLAGVVLLLASLIRVGPSGIRSWIIVIGAAPLLLIYLRNQKRPRFTTFLAIGLVGYVAITFFALLRDPQVRTDEGVGKIVVTSATKPSEAWNRLMGGGDTAMAPLLALMSLEVPQNLHYQFGLATGQVLLRPIPRQIWTSKPSAGDEKFTDQFFVQPGINLSSKQYTPLADLYLDFGYLGAFVGMAILGLLARGHYEYFRANAGNGGVQLFYAATFAFWLVLLRGSVPDTTARLAFVIPPLLIGMWLCQKAAPEE